MTERVPLLVDEATKALRQFNPDETMPKAQMSAALQLELAGLLLNDASGISATDTILQAMGKLQAQADLKETPAGALAQMRGFGLGAETGANVADLNALRAGGMYVGTAAASAAAGFPVAVGHSVLHTPGSSGSAQQFASPITTGAGNRRRLWHRQMIANGWSAPREFAFLDDPAFTGAPSTPNLKFGNVASSDVNTLDFYEKAGIFTPTIEPTTTQGAIAYTNRSGSYSRIGDRVYWTAVITLSSLGGAVGGLRIGGLPFIVSAGVTHGGGVAVGYFSGLSAANICYLYGLHAVGTATITMHKAITTGGPASVALLISDVTDTFQIRLGGVYKVN